MRTKETAQAEWLGEGLGHRGGVLRGLIQDPASGLPRIPLLRGSVNKGLSANGMHTSTALARPGSEVTSNSPPSERFRPLPHRP
jgi:hypothetical protein